MIVSPFTPLFFNVPKSYGIDGDYIQTFATTDRILIQLIAQSDEAIPEARIEAVDNMSGGFIVPLKSWKINEHTKILFAEISPSEGIYTLTIESIGTCEPFRVTDKSMLLENTTLIQYSMKNNRQRRDAAFFIDNVQYFFDWRVPGGFKDSNWSFSVESEQFVTPYADISQLYGLESTQKKFTLGGSDGVPIWFGEMLNRILVCSHVYFDGVKYSRKESNTPEVTVQLEGVNAFVFNQTLQRSVYLDPVLEEKNRLIMRRINGVNFRNIGNNNYRKI